MPVLDPKLASNPQIQYSGPVQPNYNFWDVPYDKIGGADTMLSRLTGNYYDRSFIPEISQINQRYHNQSTLNAHASNLLKLGLGVGTGAIAMANALTTLSPVGIATSLITGKTMLETLQDNPLHTLYTGAQNMINTALPTFVREDFDQMGVLSQLGNGRIGEFLTRNNESLQFIVEAFATSGAMAALKIGARGALALSKTRPMYKALTSLQGDNIAAAASKLDWLATSSVLSANEAMLEAEESYKNNVAKMEAERRAGNNNFTDQEITSSAEAAANNVFWQNAATLMITNGAFMKLVNPMFKPAEALTRGNKHALRFADGNFQLPKYASAGATAFEKFMYDKADPLGRSAKALLENVVSEGLEESLQHSVQKVNEVHDALHSDNSLIGSTIKYLKTLPDVINLSDPERLNATLLGSILGGAQVAVSNAVGLGAAGEAIKYRKEREQHLNSLQGSYTDFIKSTIYARHEDKQGALKKDVHQDGTIDYIYKIGDTEQKINQQDYEMLTQKHGLGEAGGTFTVKGEFKMDEKGNLIQDPVKVAQFMKDAFIHAEYDDLIDTEELRTNPDALKLRFFREQKLAALAKTAFDAGAADLLIDRLEQIGNSSEGELKGLGMDPELTRKQIPAMIKHVEELEKLYNTHLNTAIIASNSKDDNALNRGRQEYLYELGSRIISMDTMLRDLNDEVEQKKQAFVKRFDNEEDRAIAETQVKRMTDKFYLEDKIEELFEERQSLLAAVVEAEMRGDLDYLKKIQEDVTKVNDRIQLELDKRKDFETEDVQNLGVYVDSSALTELAQLSNKAKHVTDAREELGRTFDKILDSKKGFQTYKEIRKKSPNPRTIYDVDIKNFRIHDQITSDVYQFYEDRMVPKLRLEDKAEMAAHEFYSETIDRFVDWFNYNLDLPNKSYEEIANSLRQLVADILQKKPRLYMESANELANKIDEMIGLVGELQADYNAYLSTVSNPGDPVEHMDALDRDNPQKADEIFPAFSKWELGQKIKAAMEPLYSNRDTVVKTIYSFISEPRSLQTEEELRVLAMERQLESAQRVIDLSAFDGEKIDPEYTDEISPVYEMRKLIAIRDRILPFKGTEFKETYARVREMVRSLETIIDLVNQNIHNRELKNHKENALYAGSYLMAVGINQDGTLADSPIMEQLIAISSKETMEAIGKASVTNPTIAIKAVESIAKQDPELMKRVILMQFGEMSATLAQTFSTFKRPPVTEEEMSALLTSPVRLFKHILAAIVQPDFVQTRYPNVDIKEFLQDFDIVKLMETRRQPTDQVPNPKFVDRTKSALNNDGMDILIGVYLNSIALNTLLMHVDNTVSNVDFLQTLLDYANQESKGTKKPTPSSAQERVIMQLANWLSATPSTSNEVNKNVAALKAPPGAGKSLVVTPLALRLAGITPEKIMTAASTETAAENIAKAVGNTTSNTMETLTKLLETGQIPSDVTTLIVDEVGPATYETIDALSRAVAKFNKNNTARVPLKMLYIFDPNQVTAGYKEIPDIEGIGFNTPSGYDNLTPEEKKKAREGEYELGMDLVFTQNIYDVTPLSATYRSDVAAIHDLFNAFRTEQQVTELSAAASVDPRVSTKDVLGTFVEVDTKNLEGILRSSVVTNPSRTRAVIVGSEAKKLVYDNSLRSQGINPDVARVLTVSEAQGLTFDEVYVDITREDSPSDFPGLFQSDKAYNKYLYTALSRASQFAYLSRFPATNGVDSTIPDKTAASAARKKSDYEQYAAAKKTDIDLLKSLLKDVETSQSAPQAVATTDIEKIDDEVEATPTTPIEPVEEITDADVDNYIDKAVDEMAEEAEKKAKRKPIIYTLEEAIVASENNIDEVVEQESLQPEEALPIESADFDYFHLRYPENYAFSQVGDSPPLQVGDKILFVKDTYNANPFDNKERILVVRDEGNGKYRRVAVLSDKERPEVEKAMGFDFKKLKGISFYPQDGGEYFVTHEGLIGKNEAYHAFVGPDTQGVTYRYDYGEPTMQLNKPSDTVALFNKWAQGLFGPDYQSKILNYKEIVEEPSKFMAMKVFGSPAAVDRYFEGRKKPRVSPKQHVPYLIISGLKVDGYKDEMVPHYIRLTSNIVNKATPIVVVEDSNGKSVTLTMQTLKQFHTLVKEFENLLKANKALGQYSTSRMGVPATDSSGKVLKDRNNNPFYVFHALVKALSDQYVQKGKSPIKILGHGKTGEDIKGLSEDIKKMFPDIDPATLSDKLLLLAARIDSMQHFGDMYAIEKGRVKPGTPRSFNGHAQIVLNKLATSNFMITLPGSKKIPGATSIILRDYESTRLTEGNTVENMVARRLLGPVSAVKRNFAYNPLLRQTVINKLEKYAKTLQAAGKTDSIRYRLIQDILNKRDEFDLQNTRLTSDQLGQLVDGHNSSGDYKNISEGFGLRAPITIVQKGEEGTLQFDRNVGTTFRSVSPTVLTVSKVKYEPEQKEAIEVPKPDIAKFIQLNGNKAVQDLVDQIFKDYSDAEIKAFTKRMKAPTLQQAVQEYLISARSPRAIRQLGLTLAKTVKNIAAMVTGYDSKAEMLDALYRDNNYWKEDSKTKFGPRDSVRLALAISLFPEIPTSEKLTRLVALFKQNRWYHVQEFQETAELNQEKFTKDIAELVDAALKVAKRYNVQVKAVNFIREDGAVDVEGAVEFIAEEIGSKVRKALKKDPEALPVEETGWAQVLATLVHNRDNASIPSHIRGNEEQAKKAGLDINNKDSNLIADAYEYVLTNNILPLRSMLKTSELDDIGELLSDTEARELYERMLPASNIPIISKIFSSKRGESFKIISMNHMQHQLGKNNWGLFKDGIVHVVRHASGGVGSKVVKHEVLHKIIWQYLEPFEREMLWQLGRERFGNLSGEALEERIVQEFTDNFNTPTGIWNSLKQLYYKIMKFLGFTYINLTSLDEFFSTIEAGYYSGKGRTVSGIERNLKINKDWAVDDLELLNEGHGALESYLTFEDTLFDVFNLVYHQPRTGGEGQLLSFEEAIEETFFTLQDIYEDPTSYRPDESPAFYKKLRKAIYPILNPDSKARKDVIDEYFPQNREAERLAMAINELQERYEALLDERETSDLDPESEEAESLDKSIKDIEEELGIKSELYESELRDPATKLTGRVKQRLGGIEYLEKATIKRAEFSKTFNALLTYGTQLDHSSLENFVSSLTKKLEGAYSIRGGATHQKTVGAALAKHMRDTAQNIVRLERTSNPRVTFRKDSSSLLEYVIIASPGNSSRSVTKSEAMQKPSTYRVMERLEGETLHEYANRITSEFPNLNYDAVKNAYYLYEELAFISSIVSAVNSLRPNKPHVGLTYFNFGIQSDYYFPTKASGPSYVMDSDINAAVIQYIDRERSYHLVKPEHTELFPKEFLDGMPLPESTTDKESQLKKRDTINEFLKLIGLNKSKRIVDFGNSDEINSIYFRFYHFIQNLREGFLAPPTEDDLAKFGEVEFRPALALIENEHSIKEALIDKMFDAFSAGASSVSYRRADNKTAYRFVDASFQSSVMNYIDNAIRAKQKGSVPEGVIKPLHMEFRSTSKGVILTTAAPLLKNNIFVNGNTSSQIREFVDHDGMKIAGQEGWAKYLKSETPTDYHKRNFNFGFLSRFYKSRGNSYIQFLPNPPQNRSSIQGAEVTYHTPEVMRSIVLHILKAQMSRPTPKEAGLEHNESYVNNYRKILFPGLVMPDGSDMTVDGLMQLAKRKGDVQSAAEAGFEMFLKHVERQSKEAANEFMSDFQGNEIRVSEHALLYAAKQMKIKVDGYLNKREQAKLRKEIEANPNLNDDQKQKAKDELKQRADAPYQQLLEKVFFNFYLNFSAHQYGLSELVYSDQVLYSNKENQSKRIQVATATGDIGLIDPARGAMAPTSRVGVMEDISLGIQMELEQVRDDSFGEEYDSTDGQGFVTPEFYERMTNSYSIESQLDVTLKPVYYAIHENGEVVALKYSLVVLTDELCKQYPHLNKLREDMRNNVDKDGKAAPLDQAVFNSAVKVGNPRVKSQVASKLPSTKGGFVQYKDKSGTKNGFHPDSILTIHNKYLRLQLNPAKQVDGSVRNPSQITAFMNSNGRNQVESSKLFGYNSLIIESGLKKVMKDLKVNSKGALSKAAKLAIREKLMNLTDGLPGAEDVNAMLSYKANGQYGISMNIPLLAKRVVSALSSNVTRDTVGFRFPGSQLVLQAQVGVSENLKWKDKDGYTEVILPESYRQYVNKGDILTDGLVAFRIPSTNYHSALALKVVGFYPTPPGSKGNIIIAPSLIVYYHGSDYDIDKLFIIRKEEHKGEDINVVDILSRYGIEADASLNVKAGDVYGFKNGEEIQINNVATPHYLHGALSAIEAAIDTKRTQIMSANGNAKKALVAEIENMEDDYYQIIDLIQKSSKNAIVNLFSSNLRNIKNRKDVLTPISFNRAAKIKQTTIKELDKHIDAVMLQFKTEGMLEPEVDKALLKEALLSGEMSKLSEVLPKAADTDLARRMLVRYGVEKMEDSVMEMQAKRNMRRAVNTNQADLDIPKYPSRDIVNKWIYPIGQLNDYMTQKAIHTNTYSGARLTGISANSGKMLGYLFEATPPTVIIDTVNGKTYKDTEIRKLVTSYRLETVSALMEKYPRFQVAEREDVRIKDTHRISVDGRTLDSFSRYEKNMETGEDVTLPVSNDKISIFETIDTIINLAIDNVKEQKLFSYGITSSNANAFFTMLAMGTPLNTVVKFFSSPIIAAASKNRRISSAMLTEETKGITNRLYELLSNGTDSEIVDALTPFMSEKQISKILDKKVKSKSADVIDDLITYIGNNGSINSEVLDDIYTAEPMSANIEDISNLISIRSLQKMLDMGEELFATAQLFSLLRGMPSGMSGVMYLNNKPKKYAKFDYAANLQDLDPAAYIERSLEYIKENDPRYKLAKNKEEYLKNVKEAMTTGQSQKLINIDLAQMFERKFTNSMLHSTLRNSISPSSDSVFENVSPLSIPHVYSSWKTLNFLKGVIERTFAMHNPVLKAFASNLVEKANLFTTYNEYELIEKVAIQFFSFITSNLDISIHGRTLNLDESKNYLDTPAGRLYGVEAWATKFIDQVFEAKSKDETDNRFLSNLEIVVSPTGAKSLRMFSDKIRDPKIKEGIRADYLALYRDPATRNLALDVFKYAIIAEGLLYSRSSLALVFPASFIASYSSQFENRLNTFLSKTNNGAKTLANLDQVLDIFTFQFLRNNTDVAPYIRRYKPAVTSTKPAGEFTKQLFSGIERGLGTPFYYDLKFKGLSPENSPRFIKRYGSELYAKIDVQDDSNTYYRQVTSAVTSKYYDIHLEQDMKSRYDYAPLLKADLIVPAFFVRNNILEDDNPSNKYEVGDTIYTFERGNVRPSKLTAYKVVSMVGNNPKLSKEPSLDVELNNAENNNVFIKYSALQRLDSFTVVNQTSSKVRAIALAAQAENGVAIVNGEMSENTQDVIAIPTNLDLSDFQKLELKLQNLDPLKTYYIQDNVLASVTKDFQEFLAAVLQKSIGYSDEHISDILEQEDSVSLYYKLKAATKNRAHFRAGEGSNDAYSVSDLATINTEGVARLPYKNLPVFNKTNPGDVIYMGMNGSIPQFAYVEGIESVNNTPTYLVISLIPSNVAAQMDKDNYTGEEYEALLQEFEKNSKC